MRLKPELDAVTPIHREFGADALHGVNGLLLAASEAEEFDKTDPVEAIRVAQRQEWNGRTDAGDVADDQRSARDASLDSLPDGLRDRFRVGGTVIADVFDPLDEIAAVGNRRHGGEIEMGVGVDESGEDEAVGLLDDCRAGRAGHGVGRAGGNDLAVAPVDRSRAVRRASGVLNGAGEDIEVVFDA